MAHRTVRTVFGGITLAAVVMLSACTWGIAKGKLYEIRREAAPTPFVISPWRQVGPVCLQEGTRESVVGVLGTPDVIFLGDTRFSMQDAPAAAHYVFSRAGLSVCFVLGRLRSISVHSELYEYPGGLRVGMHVSRAEAHLGSLPVRYRWVGDDFHRESWYEVLYSGTEAYRLADYGSVTVQVNELTGMITELRLAAPPPTDGVQALPSACLVEPFDEGEGKKLRLAHGSMLSDCGISLDTYALVPVQWAEGIGEAPRGGGEPRFTEYHYVLKSLASYMEGAKAAGSFLAAIDVMGLTAPSLSELVAEFGQPTSFVVDGDGRDFLIDSLRYGDLVLQMDDARAFLSSVTFHDRSYLYARKIGVGSASGEVYAELGKPLRTEVEAPAVSRTVPDRTLLIWPVPGETTSKIRYADKGIEVSLRDDKVESVTRVWQAPPPVLPAKAAATVPAFDWPSLLGPDGNGQSREVDWNPRSIATPKVAWTAGVGSGYSGVVVQGGRLYAAGLKAGEFTVSCLDAATGRKVWQRVVPSADKPYATPVVDGDSLFVLTTDGLLHRLDTRSGRLVWSRDLVREYGVLRPTFGFQGALMVEGGLILVTANTAGMAIRRDTGELAWTSDLPPKAFRSLDRQFSNGVSYATPTVYGDAGNRQALFVGWDGLSSVDVRTGKESWKFPWDVEPAYCCGNPLAFEGQVLVPSALDAAGNVAGALLNLGSTGPSVAWRTSDLFVAWYSITPLVIGGSIYTMYYGQGIGALVVNPTSIRCLDLETGRLLWQESFGPARTGKQFGLTAANGILVVLDDQGMLYTAEASPEGFRELARCDVLQGAQAERLFFAPPVLCGGRLYCRNLSEVICIDVRR